ncbi:HNH endonuclease signature motif containing protein [Clostridium thermobutyricum]|uniref:HNH endonuclease signature motif containing protein n=1 Tax=Clostridium thermobutyricum TaxID=29372 RepID=UPI0029431C70|nr:HNH endonuclease [Clostridium thermobutyricum]
MKELKAINIINPKLNEIKVPKLPDVLEDTKVYFKPYIEKSGLNKIIIDGLKTTLPIIEKKLDIKRVENIYRIKGLDSKIKDRIKKLITFNKMEVKGCPRDGEGGYWDGERGNSFFIIDENYIPKNPKSNPDGLTFGEILKKYGAEGRIKFKDGEPDFSEIAKVKVKIKNFTDNRYGKGGNFDQARDLAAKKLGMTNSELKKWMKDNRYTFHEVGDCKTMLLVPHEIHGNIKHFGGVSNYKNKVA